jgi:hypothetical protein
VKGKNERNEKEWRGRGLQEWHLEGGTLYTAHVKGICCKLIKIYNSRSYTEEVKGLRAQVIYFMLEKWR